MYALVIPQTGSANLFFCLSFQVPVPREVQDQADTSSLHPLVYCFCLGHVLVSGESTVQVRSSTRPSAAHVVVLLTDCHFGLFVMPYIIVAKAEPNGHF